MSQWKSSCFVWRRSWVQTLASSVKRLSPETSESFGRSEYTVLTFIDNELILCGSFVCTCGAGLVGLLDAKGVSWLIYILIDVLSLLTLGPLICGRKTPGLPFLNQAVCGFIMFREKMLVTIDVWQRTALEQPIQNQ